MRVLYFTQRVFSNPAFERDAAKARRPLILRYVSKTRFIEAS